MGVRTDSAPTPRPATHRPSEIWYQTLVVVICTMTPTQKMMFQKTIEYLRPNLSAIGAAIRAPIKVPMESYTRCVRSYVKRRLLSRTTKLTKATINPDFQLLNDRSPVCGSLLSANLSRKSGISRKPEICPVSYPKMNYITTS